MEKDSHTKCNVTVVEITHPPSGELEECDAADCCAPNAAVYFAQRFDEGHRAGGDDLVIEKDRKR